MKPESEGGERQHSQQRALTWAAAGAALAICYLVEPVGLGILLGALLAFTLQPLYGRLQRRLGLSAAAALTVGLTSAVLMGALTGLVWLLVSRGTEHTRELVVVLGPDGPGGGVLAALGRQAARLGFAADAIPERARALAEVAASRAALGAAAVLAATASVLLGLFFMMLSMQFMLRNTQAVMGFAKDTLPFKPEWTTDLFAEFRRVGRTTLLGTVVTGIAQGLLATVGYWLCGVPDPPFYGAATAVASLVPAIGTLLVWVPVSLGLFLSGHPVPATGMLVWGALLIVGVPDYFIRPRLVGAQSELPTLFTFAALFGGVEAFGLKGIIVGPLIMSMAVAVVRLYSREVQQRHSEMS